MKIREVKFYNSVKVGRCEVIVASAFEGTNNKPAFEIELLDNIIRIKEVGSQDWTYTVIYNTVWWTELHEQKRIEVTERNGEQDKDIDRRRHLRKAK